MVSKHSIRRWRRSSMVAYWGVYRYIVLFLVMAGTGITLATNELTSLDVRSISIVTDPTSPLYYYGSIASFGDRIVDGKDYNLMLPPGDLDLCRFPDPLQEYNDDEQLQKSASVYDQRPIGILARRGECSAETQARVVQEMRDRITNNIQLLLIFEGNFRFYNKFFTLNPDSSPVPSELNNLTIVYLPYMYVKDLESEVNLRYSQTASVPYFLVSGSEKWDFPVEISAPQGTIPTNFTSNRTSSILETDNNQNDNYYWFRIIFFSLLILSPCIRAVYLFYVAGARVHFRRNEAGRIVGLQYIPPMPFWLSNNQPMQQHAPISMTLTEEQFNRLPEVVFKSNAPLERGSDTAESDLGDATQPCTTEAGGKGTVGSSNVDAMSDASTANVKRDDHVPLHADNSAMDIESGNENESERKEAPSETATELPNHPDDERSSDGNKNGNSDHDSFTASKPADVGPARTNPAASAPDDGTVVAPTVNGVHGALVTISLEGNVEQASHITATSCTECSICIDEFHDGERVTVLPRCQHIFHKDCIKPWLLERQGCCPLCKKGVLPEDVTTDSDGSADTSTIADP